MHCNVKAVLQNIDTSQMTVGPLFLHATARATLFSKLLLPEKWSLFGARAAILLFSDSFICVEPRGANFSAYDENRSNTLEKHTN